MIPESLEPRIYALLRIVFGLMFLTYGLQKFGMLGGQAAPFLSWPFGIAGVLEVLLGVLIAVGLFAKPAAFIASGEMAVAYFMVHQPQGALPVMNQGIPAVLFCFAFLYVATRGAGAMSIDGGRVSR
ncbi:MAG: DoxX family protein [Vicinamibacterales bacterium]